MYKNTLIISRKTRSFVTLIPAMDFIGEIFQYKFLTHAALAYVSPSSSENDLTDYNLALDSLLQI